MNNPLAFTSNLAQETGKRLLDFYRPSGIQGKLKTDRTVVTEADLAADQLISAALQEKFPNDGILSEENNTIYPQNKTFVWIIDPLDGTTNFSLGMHYWGVSIARLCNGIPDLAVLYFPLLDELYSASQGGGAFLNGERLQTKTPNPSQPTTFFSCCSRANEHYQIEIRYKTRILGSATYGLCTVARGSSRLAFEVTPKVWDFSGSWLITKEAGGIIAPLDGPTPYPLVPSVDYKSRSFPLLVATTPQEWAKGKEKIKKRAL